MFCTMLKYKAETEIPHQSCRAPSPKLSYRVYTSWIYPPQSPEYRGETKDPVPSPLQGEG